MLYFYNVSKDYVKYLHDGEEARRGFSRVPFPDRVVEGPGETECVEVLEIGGREYLAPVGSYRKKQKNNVLLYNWKGEATSSVRLNYMFPVADGTYEKMDFGRIEDPGYKRYIDGEYDSVTEQEGAVRRLALSTYQTVTRLGASGSAVNWACDFKFLETLADAYVKA
ncbi:MAG: type III toxin-antitoxin system ToxN/AbiQ family toxin [Oscillospiraceae bacterium]|nr:type III toxin-antitoxin system ToxN/AbiQ family toxin [Oscillospiraceae bacterium]